MQKHSPYEMLPNALKPAQIEQWKRYFEMKRRKEACCNAPVGTELVATTVAQTDSNGVAPAAAPAPATAQAPAAAAAPASVVGTGASSSKALAGSGMDMTAMLGAGGNLAAYAQPM